MKIWSLEAGVVPGVGGLVGRGYKSKYITFICKITRDCIIKNEI